MPDTNPYHRRNIAKRTTAMFLFTCFLVLIAGGTLAGCARKEKAPVAYQTTEVVAGTAVVITAYGNKVQNAVMLAQEEYRRVDALMNRLSSRSDTTNVNMMSGREAVRVSAETFALIKKALFYSQQSAGAYDITMGPLSDAWGIGLNSRMVPGEASLTAARKMVSYKAVELDESLKAVFLQQEGMSLDLNVLARGYAVDCAIEVLKKNGVTVASITAGNVTYSYGKKPDGAWRAVVPDPASPQKFTATMSIDDLGAATAGDYQNPVLDRGTALHSNLDARTGKPSQSGLSSVTAIHASCADAAILAQTMLALGKKDGEALLAKVPGAEAIFVENGGTVSTTAGIAAKVDRISK
jgi:thiamine biosynthesis lipoprotein